MELLIKFIDQSESFTNGVELGRLLSKMEMGLEYIDNNQFPIHVVNREVIENACRQYGYIATFGQIIFEQWIEFIGIKKTFSTN